MKQRCKRAAKSGTQAGRHKRTNERQRNGIHQRLAHAQDANGDGLGDILLELGVLGLKVQRQTGTDLAAASHHKDGQQVIDALGSAVGIVEHSVDRRERLMQADGHQRQEACRQDIAAQDAQLLEDKGEDAKDRGRQPSANRLDDKHQSKGADDEHQQRGQERIERVGHDLANLTLHPGEKRTSDESRDHTARCGVVLRIGERQQNGSGRISSARRKQGHGAVGDAHHAGDTAQCSGATKLARCVIAHQNGQIGEEGPTHGANALIPPLARKRTRRRDIDDVADTVNEASRNDAGKQGDEDVGNLLKEGLNRFGLVLGLLRGLVCGRSVNYALVSNAFRKAGELGEFLEHLIHLARTQHDLHRVVLDQAYHAVECLNALRVDVARVFDGHAQARHARRVCEHVVFTAQKIQQLLSQLFVRHNSSLYWVSLLDVISTHAVHLLGIGIALLMAPHRSTDMAARPLKSYRSLLGIAVQQHRDNSGFYVAAGICKRLNSALARAAGRLHHDVLAAHHQLLVRLLYIDHQVLVHLANLDHGTGRNHIENELLDRSRLEPR